MRKDRSSLHSGVAKKLVKSLCERGITCYIWHTATTGSVYIRFEDQRMCSIRVGDHDGREKLKYKFNVRSDSVRQGWVKDKDTWRYYIHITRWKELIPILETRKEQIKSWPKGKYEYYIPSFKKSDEEERTNKNNH